MVKRHARSRECSTMNTVAEEYDREVLVERVERVTTLAKLRIVYKVHICWATYKCAESASRTFNFNKELLRRSGGRYGRRLDTGVSYSVRVVLSHSLYSVVIRVITRGYESFVMRNCESARTVKLLKKKKGGIVRSLMALQPTFCS